MTDNKKKNDELLNEFSDTDKLLLETILDSLDKDVIPWESGRFEHLMHNPVSGVTYQGKNQILLNVYSMANNWSEPRFLTFKQAASKNWRVKRGSKAIKLDNYIPYDPKTKKTIDNEYTKEMSQSELEALRERATVKKLSFNVFNAEQITGIPEFIKDGSFKEFENDLAKEYLNTTFSNMGLNIKEGGNQLLYNLITDTLVMPPKGHFKDENFYIATVLHELAHASGSAERLNRFTRIESEEDYAKEELVAELTSALMVSDLGYSYDQSKVDRSSSYIKSWYSIIKDSPNVFFESIKKAQEARQYLLKIGEFEKFKEMNESNQKEIESEESFNKEQFTYLMSKELKGKLNHIQIKQVINTVLEGMKEPFVKEGKHFKRGELSPSDELKMIKLSVSIEDYAERELGLTVVNHDHRGRKTTVEHDSLVIFRNNSYYRFSSERGGSIFDFVMEFEYVDFNEAKEIITEYYYKNELGYLGTEVDNEYKNPRKLDSNTKGIELPEANKNHDGIFRYLGNERGISGEIIQEFINREILYQDYKNNVVWIGKLNNVPLYGTRRGTIPGSTFRGDLEGSFKEVGIYLENNSDSLVLTESVIDAMSLMTLSPNSDEHDFLSINGVGSAIGTLNFHLSKRKKDNYPSKIITAFDNDKRGIKAADRVKEYLETNYPDIEIINMVPEEKDWNDELMKEKRIGLFKDADNLELSMGM